MAISKLSLSLFNPLSGAILTASLVETEDQAQCSCEEIHRRQFASYSWGEPYTLHILCRSLETRKLAWEIYNTFISSSRTSQSNQETLLWELKRICDCQEDDLNTDDDFPIWTPTGSELYAPFAPSSPSDSGTSQPRVFFDPPRIQKAKKDEEKRKGALRKHINREIIQAVRENLRAYRPKRSSRPDAMRAGYVYILASDSCPGLLKIGFSEDKPDIRRKQIQKCFEDARVVYEAGVPVSYARKVEKLVHAELQGVCKWTNCMRCGRGHREWFEVDLDLAKQVVLRWSQWMASDPYSQNGTLSHGWDSLANAALTARFEPGIDVTLNWDRSWQRWTDLNHHARLILVDVQQDLTSQGRTEAGLSINGQLIDWDPGRTGVQDASSVVY